MPFGLMRHRGLKRPVFPSSAAAQPISAQAMAPAHQCSPIPVLSGRCDNALCIQALCVPSSCAFDDALWVLSRPQLSRPSIAGGAPAFQLNLKSISWTVHVVARFLANLCSLCATIAAMPHRRAHLQTQLPRSAALEFSNADAGEPSVQASTGTIAAATMHGSIHSDTSACTARATFASGSAAPIWHAANDGTTAIQHAGNGAAAIRHTGGGDAAVRRTGGGIAALQHIASADVAAWQAHDGAAADQGAGCGAAAGQGERYGAAASQGAGYGAAADQGAGYGATAGQRAGCGATGGQGAGDSAVAHQSAGDGAVA